jgi:hypothetical protein
MIREPGDCLQANRTTKTSVSPVDLNRLSPGILHAFLVVAEIGIM